MGLFIAFTLSQAGMVVHHRRERGPRWKWRLANNGVGAAATSIVTLVVVVSKFTEGAWIPTVVIPLLVGLFWAISRHYRRVDLALACPPGTPLPEIVHTVVVLVGDRIHAGVLEALAYAKSLQPRCLHALHVSFDAAEADEMQETWAAYGFDITLDIVGSPYRELSRPVLQSIEELDDRWVMTSSPWSFPSSLFTTGGTSSCTTRARCSSKAVCSSARAPSSRRSRPTLN